jgi:hypothetical protein
VIGDSEGRKPAISGLSQHFDDAMQTAFAEMGVRMEIDFEHDDAIPWIWLFLSNQNRKIYLK